MPRPETPTAARLMKRSQELGASPEMAERFVFHSPLVRQLVAHRAMLLDKCDHGQTKITDAGEKTANEHFDCCYVAFGSLCHSLETNDKAMNRRYKLVKRAEEMIPKLIQDNPELLAESE